MRGVFDSAGPVALAFTRNSVLPSALLDAVGSLISAISELTTSGYPACICPCPTLQVRPLRRAALTWLGVRMVATPFLYDSFLHYFTPVYPDAIQAEACPTAPQTPAVSFRSSADGSRATVPARSAWTSFRRRSRRVSLRIAFPWPDT